MRRLSILTTLCLVLVLAIAPAALADDEKTSSVAETVETESAQTEDDEAGESEDFDPTFDFEVKGQVYGEMTDFGSGLDRQESRTDLHFQRLRLVITAMLDDTYGFKFQTCGNVGTSRQSALGFTPTAQDVDWNDRDIRIIDAYAIADYSDALRFKIGLTKIPLTRANLDDCFAPLSQDRSFFVYTPYGTSPAKFSRDIGAVMWGNLADERVRYYLGAFQGREGLTRTNHPFSGAVVTSSIEPKSELELVGRAHLALLDPEPGSGYQGSYLGELKVFTIGFGAAFEPDVVYRNVAPTGAVQNDETVDYTSYAADVLFEYPTTAGTFTVNGQYLNVDFDDAYLTNFNAGDRLANITGLNGQKDGFFAKVAYIPPVKVGRGIVQPYALLESWEFAHLLGINEQTIDQTGLGVNYFIKGQNLRLTFEYLKTEFETPTGFVGARVDPVTFAPIDKLTEYDTLRVMLQLGVF